MIKIKTDKRNTNKHTPYGLDLLQKSIENVCIEINLFDFSNNYFCIYLKNVKKL